MSTHFHRRSVQLCQCQCPIYVMIACRLPLFGCVLNLEALGHKFCIDFLVCCSCAAAYILVHAHALYLLEPRNNLVRTSTLLAASKHASTLEFQTAAGTRQQATNFQYVQVSVSDSGQSIAAYMYCQLGRLSIEDRS